MQVPRKAQFLDSRRGAKARQRIGRGRIAEGAQALADPALIERLTSQGAGLAPRTPAALAPPTRQDLNLWASLVKRSGAIID